jgi:hypothetical protein
MLKLNSRRKISKRKPLRIRLRMRLKNSDKTKRTTLIKSSRPLEKKMQSWELMKMKKAKELNQLTN